MRHRWRDAVGTESFEHGLIDLAGGSFKIRHSHPGLNANIDLGIGQTENTDHRSRTLQHFWIGFEHLVDQFQRGVHVTVVSDTDRQGKATDLAEVVHDPYKREVARKLLETRQEIKSELDFSEYGLASKVVVDIITLDSEACAPCQYMVEAVRDVADYFGDLILWREHKIKEKEAIAFMLGLMVKNVPTICIDGQITFVSTIPPREELIQAIQKRINERFAIRLRQAHGHLLVLGAEGDPACDEAWKHVQQAVLELGSTVELTRVTDPQEIAKYGVATTPAVISFRERIKTVGRVPSVEVVKEWIKELRG